MVASLGSERARAALTLSLILTNHSLFVICYSVIGYYSAKMSTQHQIKTGLLCCVVLLFHSGTDWIVPMSVLLYFSLYMFRCVSVCVCIHMSEYVNAADFQTPLALYFSFDY